MPAILPEHTVPKRYENCDKCELSRHGTGIVWGEGNPAAPIMVLLDNPGSREDREGNPYVCGTRATLQYGILQAGLNIEDIYVTYILKCKPLRAYNKDFARSTCLDHLNYQLEHGGYHFIMCLGDIAVKYFFNDMDSSVKSTRGKMFDLEGRKVLTSYHPLAARRRPNLLPLFIEDCKLLSDELGKTVHNLQRQPGPMALKKP